jgi:hypothetical protein
MSRFSASQMAMTGFRVVRENPAAVVVWALLQGVGVFATLGTVVGLVGGPFAELQALSRDPNATPDPQRVMAILAQLAPVMLLAVLLAVVAGAVVTTAMNRVVLRPQDKAFAFLRLGGDELRQMLLNLMVMFTVAGGYIALLIAIVVLAITIGLLYRAAPVVGFLLGGAGGIGGIGAVVYVAVRLSLASARTFVTGRVDLFGSWDVTRGHFWPILGTYVLAAFLMLVVVSMGNAVIFCIAAVTTGLGPTADVMIHPDYASVARYFTPSAYVYLGLNAVVSAVSLPITATPAAAIYAALTDGPAPTPVIEGGLYVPKV